MVIKDRPEIGLSDYLGFGQFYDTQMKTARTPNMG